MAKIEKITVIEQTSRAMDGYVQRTYWEVAGRRYKTKTAARQALHGKPKRKR